MWERRAPAETGKGAPQRAAGFLSAGFHAGFAQRVSRLKWTQRAQLEVVFQVPVHSTTPNAKCTCLAQPLQGGDKKNPHTPSRVCFSNRLEFQGDFCLQLIHNTEGCFSTALHLHRVLKQTQAVPAGEILVLHLHRAQNPRCCKPHVSCCGNLLWKVQEI